MRRRPLLAAASLLLAAMVLLAAPAAAGAKARPAAGVRVAAGAAAPGQEPDAPADDGTGGSGGSAEDEPAPGGHIIPEPNSGRAPEDAGDRGGGLQVLVFVLLVAGVGSIAALGVRDARRSRSRDRAARPLP
jgi:hypothetical protein